MARYKHYKYHRRHRYYRHHTYLPNHLRHHHLRRSYSGAKNIVIITLVLLIIGVTYLLLFNPPIPNQILPILSPIIYIVELLIFILGLSYLNGFGLGESDLGIVGFIALGIVLILLGGFFLLGAGAVSRVYLGFEEWFSIILGLLGLFSLFRATRRYGQFVYVR